MFLKTRSSDPQFGRFKVVIRPASGTNCDQVADTQAQLRGAAEFKRRSLQPLATRTYRRALPLKFSPDTRPDTSTSLIKYHRDNDSKTLQPTIASHLARIAPRDRSLASLWRGP